MGSVWARYCDLLAQYRFGIGVRHLSIGIYRLGVGSVSARCWDLSVRFRFGVSSIPISLGSVWAWYRLGLGIDRLGISLASGSIDEVWARCGLGIGIIYIPDPCIYIYLAQAYIYLAHAYMETLSFVAPWRPSVLVHHGDPQF